MRQKPWIRGRPTADAAMPVSSVFLERQFHAPCYRSSRCVQRRELAGTWQKKTRQTAELQVRGMPRSAGLPPIVPELTGCCPARPRTGGPGRKLSQVNGSFSATQQVLHTPSATRRQPPKGKAPEGTARERRPSTFEQMLETATRLVAVAHGSDSHRGVPKPRHCVGPSGVAHGGEELRPHARGFAAAQPVTAMFGRVAGSCR